MLDVLSKTSISEVILIFLLLFVLPLVALLLRRLRKYEALYGVIKEEGRKKKKKKKDKEDEPASEAPPAAPAAPQEEAPPDNSYPYQSRPFLSSADKACLGAMREALGPDVDVFAKVALWETVESTEKAAGYANRLKGLAFDYLVCDRRTGQTLTAVMYNPGKGRPAGPIDEIKKVCAAAKANVVFIDMAEEYDVKTLSAALGIPNLDV